MFDFFRRKRRFFVWIFLFLVGPAFLFFGMQQQDIATSEANVLVTVDDSVITKEEFQKAYEQKLSKIKEVLGASFDPKMFDTPIFKEQIVDDLITESVLLNEAHRKGLWVSDKALQDTIGGFSEFLSDAGAFDIQKYKTFLFHNGLSVEDFERSIREKLILRLIPSGMIKSLILPDSLVDELIYASEQTRDVRELSFPPALFESRVSISEKELREFYSLHLDQFKTQETADVEYLVFSEEDLKKRVKISEEALRIAYSKEIDQKYKDSNRRKISHILIEVSPQADSNETKKAKDKALSILEELRSGADFSEMAKKHSQDKTSSEKGGDLGFFSRGELDPILSVAVFSLNKVGDLSQLVRTKYGYHIIQLDGIKVIPIPSFESLRPMIESAVRQEEARKSFLEESETFRNAVYEEPNSLSGVAKKMSLIVQRVSGVRRTGEGLVSEMKEEKFLEDLFSQESIAEHRSTEVLELDHSLVVARLINYFPETVKSFESVQDIVRTEYKKIQSQRLAVSEGLATLLSFRLWDTVFSNQTNYYGPINNGPIHRLFRNEYFPQVLWAPILLEDVLLSYLAPSPALPLTLFAKKDSFYTIPWKLEQEKTVHLVPSDQVPAKALAAIFRGKAEDLPRWVGVDLGSEGYRIYQVLRSHFPSASVAESLRPEKRRQLEKAYSDQIVSSYVAFLKQKAKIVRHSIH